MLPTPALLCPNALGIQSPFKGTFFIAVCPYPIRELLVHQKYNDNILNSFLLDADRMLQAGYICLTG